MITTPPQIKTRRKKAAPKLKRSVPVVEEICDYCDGAGVTERMGFGFSGGYSRLKTCPKCHGSGR